MKKTLNRIISAMVVFVMIITMLPTVSLAAGAEMDLKVSTVSGCPGDTVTVTVELDNNPGIASLKFDVTKPI